MSRVRLPAPRWWMIALAGALAYLACDTATRIRHVNELSGLYGVAVDPPAVDAASPTGYSLGRRSAFFPGGGLDSLHWVMQTQAMFASGTWRIHAVGYDNAPRGREMHWASPFRWWMGLIAWVDHVMTGTPIGLAVERAALYADPLLLALAMLGLVPLTAGRFGSCAATLLAVGMVAALPFYGVFVAGYADHHGIAESCALMTVLFLLAGAGGFTRTGESVPERLSAGERVLWEWLPDRRTARGWFTASAVAGGVGLWISTASQVPVLVGIGAGAIWAFWLGRAPAAGGCWVLDPSLWRWWGLVGGATSFVTYLVEYFPAHMTLRLEVNHPLYALAWLGAGELLCRMARLSAGARPAFQPREVGAWLAGALGVGLLPVVVLATGHDTFFVADEFVWRLHTRYIGEFQRLTAYPFSLGIVINCLPVVLVLPALYFMIKPTIPRVWKAHLVLALAAAALPLGMAFMQVRWWGMYDAILFALLAVLFALLERLSARRLPTALWLLGCALVFLPGAITAVKTTWRNTEFTEDNVYSLAERDIAHWLRLRMGRDPAVVLSSPVATTKLIYHGGLTGLGTLYWENREGLEHAAEIFAARSPDEAYGLIRRYGITHIVLLSWDTFAAEYVQLYRDLPVTGAVPNTSFILTLLQGNIPSWLRMLPFRLPDHPALARQSVWILEVTPPQRPEEAVARAAEYRVEMERPGLALQMLPILEQAAHYFPALVTLAYVQAKTGEAPQFSTTLARIVEDLSPAADLELEDRVRLAAVLRVGGRTDLAREQLRRCMTQLNERALRRLPAGTLADFLGLGEELGIWIPDPELRQLAARLLPPYLREKH